VSLPIRVDVAAVEVGAPPDTADPGSIVVHLWNLGTPAEVLPPRLTDAERERLRAVGYLE
jgi:hypothetical protein